MWLEDSSLVLDDELTEIVEQLFELAHVQKRKYKLDTFKPKTSGMQRMKACKHVYTAVSTTVIDDVC